MKQLEELKREELKKEFKKLAERTKTASRNNKKEIEELKKEIKRLEIGSALEDKLGCNSTIVGVIGMFWLVVIIILWCLRLI